MLAAVDYDSIACSPRDKLAVTQWSNAEVSVVVPFILSKTDYFMFLVPVSRSLISG